MRKHHEIIKNSRFKTLYSRINLMIKLYLNEEFKGITNFEKILFLIMKNLKTLYCAFKKKIKFNNDEYF